MDSPIGMNSDIWLPIQDKLSKMTKVCVYDRAGLGMSERPIDPKEDKNSSITKAKIQRGQAFTLERYKFIFKIDLNIIANEYILFKNDRGFKKINNNGIRSRTSINVCRQ